MINEQMYELGNQPNKIRELFAYGEKLKNEVGASKVFDYSIGNPSIPTPDPVTDCLVDEIDRDPVKLHAYTQSAGDAFARQMIAKDISEKHAMQAEPGNIYMTCGAAAALAISLCAITQEGDDVIVVSPYFPEYATWIETARCNIVEVPALEPSFQLDVAAIEAAITPRTSAIIINSPNNPTGAIYTEENLRALANVLALKEAELERQIFLISDEPYREIAYGKQVPWIPALYDDAIVCYSFSKSFSLPGERIGYIYVSERIENAADVFLAICGAGRALGYVCAPSLMQRVVAQCLVVPINVDAYEENRELLTSGLSELGYEFVPPDGAFYLWVKALEPDANAFSERAKKYGLLLVPSNSFGSEGWVRLSYCIDSKTIERSMPAFRELMESYR